MLCRAFPARRRWPSGTAVGGVRASVPLQGASWRSGSANGSRTFFFKRGPPPKLFDIEGLEAPKDFPRLASDAVRSAQQVLDGAERKGPGELVAALDTASNELCRIADAAELCRNVHPNQEFVAAASDAVGIVAGYMGEVNFDVGIYEAMLRGESGEQFEKLPLETKTVLRHMRLSMEHEGIHLPEAQKGECLQLLEREQQLSFDIVQQQEQKRGDISTGSLWLPLENLREPLAGQVDRLRKRKQGTGAEEVLLPSDPMWSEQVLRRSPCASTRRAVFEAQQALDEEGEAAMADLRDVRHNLAGMRGYQSWNAYAQRESLLSDPRRVESFLDSVWDRLRPGLLQDMKELAAEKERSGLGVAVLDAWDVPMLLDRSRERHREDDRLGAYLSYASLMRGVDMVLSRLLGVAFVAETPAPGEVWHPSVQKFSLREGERVLGILYLDPFARPGKTVQSAQFTLQGSKKLDDGGRQIPVTTLVYALPVGNGRLPVSYAVTFMHEIGHAVHSLLSQTDLQHLSGTRGSVDFVEFPSHLFEHFVLDADCLAAYATHSQTSAAMPAEIRDRYRQGQSRFAHFEATQQLMYAVVDQAFYDAPSPSSSTASKAGRVHERLNAALARFDDDFDGPFRGRFTSLLGLTKPSKFDHLVHYGGSYYCYLFNRALSAHVWQHGFRADPFGVEPGRRLRTMLQGGSVVQSLEVIEALCPDVGGFPAEQVPLDAFISQLRPTEI